MQSVAFILVIASLVQMLEFILKDILSLFSFVVCIFLITTNCVILGVAILVVQKDYNLAESIIYAISTARLHYGTHHLLRYPRRAGPR